MLVFHLCNRLKHHSRWLLLVIAMPMSIASFAQHPNLVITKDDVQAMRAAIKKPGSFATAFEQLKAATDAEIALPVDVPMPKDAGGGYTHERHKKNYQLMYNAGVLYQLTQDKRYANFVQNMLLQYAQMYPDLPRHPMRKSSNEGKLFWQGLNEAVWLVYTIQAYDLVVDALPLSAQQRIEQGALRPVALFLSKESPHTFNKVHNHGTWATAAVGMTGYVLGEQAWVEQALYDLNLSGNGGFMRQLDELFSPQGYYAEGPYYQRYALLPFITFANAIENNEPERGIFEYRDKIILKAITTTIELSYNGLFFPLNDAIKDKGIDTIELVNGVALAYRLTGDDTLLSIAKAQDQILLTGNGLSVAKALDAQKAQPFVFESRVFGDGKDGDQGALVLLRKETPDPLAVVFKATTQGLGHGHFDKLNWQFYDKGEEIVTDYGAARFLNVEAKAGGRYLPENETWAKQTVAHNTLVVDQQSHFNGKTSEGNKHAPKLLFFSASEQGEVVSAQINSAYEGVSLRRTLALLALDDGSNLIVDIFSAFSDTPHQFDLPLHYNGQLIDTNIPYTSNAQTMSALGDNNGYQHLWLAAQSKTLPKTSNVTWLNDNGKFYTLSFIGQNDAEVLFTKLGANDPNFNLRAQSSFIQRINNAKNAHFVSVLEPHGEYNPSKEFTLAATSRIANIERLSDAQIDVVTITMIDGKQYVLAINHDYPHKQQAVNFSYKGQSIAIKKSFTFVTLPN